jgi:hypothetical protein
MTSEMPSVVSIATGRRPRPQRPGEYLLLELALSEAPLRNTGVLLRGAETDEVYSKIRGSWDEIPDAEEVELLEAFDEDFEAKIRETDGDEFLRHREDSLSNTLRVSERTAVVVDDFPRTLARLYEEHAEAEQAQPFVTYLPLYPLRAAATKFGDDLEVEADGWVKAPPKLRLTSDMLVARIAGRSVQPRIPNGTLCVFRCGVVGSRLGQLLLVERFGTTERSAPYTINTPARRCNPVRSSGSTPRGASSSSIPNSKDSS